jgi:hypothetical protein
MLISGKPAAARLRLLVAVRWERQQLGRPLQRTMVPANRACCAGTYVVVTLVLGRTDGRIPMGRLPSQTLAGMTASLIPPSPVVLSELVGHSMF